MSSPTKTIQSLLDARTQYNISKNMLEKEKATLTKNINHILIDLIDITHWEAVPGDPIYLKADKTPIFDFFKRIRLFGIEIESQYSFKFWKMKILPGFIMIEIDADHIDQIDKFPNVDVSAIENEISIVTESKEKLDSDISEIKEINATTGKEG